MIRQCKVREFSEIYAIGWLLTQWVFRGHGNAQWHLETKVERVSSTLEDLGPVDLERLAIQRFRSEAQQFAAQFPEQDRTVDWLALLQHHGGPTRLLDFTKSIYIALFFAIENSTTKAAIWAVNERKLFEGLQKKLSLDAPYRDYNLSKDRVEEIHGEHKVLDSGILPVAPLWMSDRQSLQQGLFLYPENLRSLPKGDGKPKRHMSFEDNLAAEFGLSVKQLRNPGDPIAVEELIHDKVHLDQAILKIVIPKAKAIRRHLTGELLAMNISARTLFPGIEGLARSYNYPKEGYESSRMWAFDKMQVPKIFEGYFR